MLRGTILVPNLPLPFFRVHWFFKSALKLGILCAIVIFIVVFRRIVVNYSGDP